MVVVGAIAIAANVRPVKYLQNIVVFSSTSAAASFLVPLVMSSYWRRATAAGALASMLAGCATVLCLFAIGWNQPSDPMIGAKTGFRPYYLLNLEPIVWGLAASLVAGVVFSLWTSPPPRAVVDKLFGKEK
jgi:Na+/proline symporter